MQPFPLSPQPTPIQNSLSPEGGGVGGGEGSEEDLAIDQGWVGGNTLCFISLVFLLTNLLLQNICIFGSQSVTELSETLPRIA